MKTTSFKFNGKVVALAALLATANLAMAQSTVTTSTTTSAGTVREFSPSVLTVTTDSSPTPTRYTYSKTTTYVDENGNPVEARTVRSGSPVTVYYDRDGDNLMATKVVVRKSIDAGPDGTVTRETSTTTSSQGTVSAFNPDALVVQSDGSTAPQSYSFSKTTTYVDENGNPVSVDTVRSGVPVTVYYDRDGDRMIANRVVVKTSTVDPNAQVIEHKKTTTTTTESHSDQ
jgi:hypothetical protein